MKLTEYGTCTGKYGSTTLINYQITRLTSHKKCSLCTKKPILLLSPDYPAQSSFIKWLICCRGSTEKFMFMSSTKIEKMACSRTFHFSIKNPSCNKLQLTSAAKIIKNTSSKYTLGHFNNNRQYFYNQLSNTKTCIYVTFELD